MSFDISWDEVAKWVVADDASLDAWASLLKQYPDRFLFGSDAVAPKTQADYLKTFDAYQRLWERLDADDRSQGEVAELRAHLRCSSREGEGVGSKADPKLRPYIGRRLGPRLA